VSAQGRKALLFFVGLAALAAVGAGAAKRLLRFAAGPEAEILTALKQTEGASLRLDVEGAPEPLVSSRHAFDRVVVDVDPDGEAARVAATLDFEGRLGSTTVSSLGLERIRWRRADGEWIAPDGLAPLLSRVVGALERRRRALEGGDSAALAALLDGGGSAAEPDLQRVREVSAREYRAVAWYIRTERDEVLVTEEYRLLGQRGDRAVDESGARQLVLHERRGQFLFSGGLR
jgi:hypothetical protein